MKLHLGCRFVAFLLLAVQAAAMFSKRGLPDLEGCAHHKRFRRNVADLFLSNDVSAHRAVNVFNDARLAGACGVYDIARGSNDRKHANRNLIRRLLKGTGWCRPYYALVRVWDPKSQTEVRKWLPFLLPHEIVWCLLQKKLKETLLQTQGMCDESLKHISSVFPPAQDMLGIGIWSDGCPCNYDRTQSLEVWTVNLPGLLGHSAEFRIPVCVLQKRFMVKHNTADDICSILSWSFQCLAQGVFPKARHDTTSWKPGDTWRKKRAGKKIGLKGCLVEVRGDWKMLQETFRLPSWASKENICWRCSAKPSDVRKCGLDAPWRSLRKDIYQALADIISRDPVLSPLFSVPWFNVSCFRLDWLHVADLGTTSDFIGSLFALVLLPRMAGHSESSRCSNLFLAIRSFYERTGAENRLNNLTVSMFKSGKKGFKLRAKAAEARGLVPFCKEICHRLLSPQVLLENTIIQAADSLSDMYDCLAADRFESDKLAQACRRFCLLVVALEQTCPETKGWRVKPKLHLLQEMCECSDNRPSQMWTYRDESFGGDMAKAARSRGGRNSPLGVGRNVLLKYLAKHPVPVFGGL